MARSQTRQSRPPPEAVRVADRIHSAAIRLLRRLRTADTATGLSAPRLSALSVIVYAGPISIGALARAEQVRAPTVSRLVKAFERDGLVTRTRDRADERVQLVRATSQGRRVLERGRRRRVGALAAAIAALPRAERSALRRAATVLLRMEL